MSEIDWSDVDFNALLQAGQSERLSAACDLVGRALLEMVQVANQTEGTSNPLHDVGFLLVHHAAVGAHRGTAEARGFPLPDTRYFVPRGVALAWAAYRDRIQQLQDAGLKLTDLTLPTSNKRYFHVGSIVQPEFVENLMELDPTGAILITALAQILMMQVHPGLDDEDRGAYIQRVASLALTCPRYELGADEAYKARMAARLRYIRALHDEAIAHILGNTVMNNQGQRLIPEATIPSELIVGAAVYVSSYAHLFKLSQD